MFIRIKDTGSHAINYQGGNSQQQTVLDSDQLSSDWASYFPAPADGAYDRINDAFSGNGSGSVLSFQVVTTFLYLQKPASPCFSIFQTFHRNHCGRSFYTTWLPGKKI